MKKTILTLLIFAVAASHAAATQRIDVFVSIAPQAYFVERIGGDFIAAHVLVGPGRSPHDYEPTPRQTAELADARVYFRIGVPFENGLVGKLSDAFKDLRIVDLRKGIALREDPDEGGMDPHVWLDPKLAKIMARTIYETLKDLDGTHEGVFRSNLDGLLADLDAVDAKIAAVLAPIKGREFMVYHPAFGYFGASYGLKQVAIEERGKEPTARRIAAMIDLAKARNIKVIFVEPQFSRKSAETLAQAVGAAVVPMDPLARDYLKNLEDMAAKIKQGLEAAGGR